MKRTPRSTRGIVGRIAVLAIGLVSPVVAIVAAQTTGTPSAGKSWNAPLIVAGGTTTTVSGSGKSWN